jgi:hypothetical protein
VLSSETFATCPIAFTIGTGKTTDLDIPLESQ